MVRQDEPISVQPDARMLLDENEQLRTSLESALEENANLTEDRDRLLRRVAEMARELQTSHSAYARERDIETALATDDAAETQRSQSDEELRVAFEELQVLTEELEVANSSLHQTNQQLDNRVEERTRQIRESNAALRSSEASFRTISDLVPDLLWRADRRGDATWFNQRWYNLTGQDAGDAVGLGWLDAVHPEDLAHVREGWQAAMESGQPYQHEHRIRDAEGNYRWFLIRAEPLRDSGRILHWFAAGADIHDQRVAIEALEQSEQRFRTLIEGMPQLVWRSENGGQWTWSSPQWHEYTAQSDEQARALGWLDALHPDDRAAAQAAWAVAPEGGVLELEARIFHAKEQRHRHFRTRALPVRRSDGEIMEWLGTSTDVDDILQLQKHQSVLVTELQHRTRNLMAVVQAVTLRTLKGVSNLEDFRKCIDDRLQALARVQGLLSRRDGALRVPFDLLLREELSAHVALDAQGNGEQVSVDGPRGVALRSGIVQTFALAIHELATNAVKYGALASPEGRLTVRWGVRPRDDRARTLWVDWLETGVADVPNANEKPRGGGYGRELLERALPYQLGARTHYGFEEQGIHCTIELEVPLDDAAQEKANG